MSITIKLGRAFITFDSIGFHAGISGTRFECAKTDDGWVFG